MWSRELRRYERSGSWSPPLRRAPRRIYSIESIASVEGHHQQQQQQQEDEVGRPGSSGSSVGSGRCATTATTTTTGTTSCLECAKLESQYTGGFGTGKSLLPRTVGPVESSSREPPSSGTGEHESREPKKSEQPSRGIDPTVDDRRQKGRRQQRMCSSQTADLGVESVSARIVVDGPLEPPADLVVQGEPAEEDDDDDEEEEEEDEDEQDLDPEGEYLSHSSSVSSIASQSYRVSGAPARANDHDLSDLSEFLQQEQLAARADVPGDEPSKLVNGVENDCEAAGQVAPVGVGNSAPGDHSRERAPVASGPTAATAEARGRDEQSESTHPGPESDAVKQFPLRSAKRQRQRRPSDDSSVALSALSEDSDSTSASDFEDGNTGGGGGDERQTNARVDEKDQARLDEYISNLLLDNLNNLADAKELVLATSERDGDTILGVYSERRAQLDEGVTVAVVASTDRQNNNHELGAQEPTAAGGGQRASTPSGAMKQKLTGKYIGGGGGVVCNSPPQQEKRVVDPKAEGDAQECDKENEEDVVNNNNNSSNNVGKASHGKHGEERNHRRQKGLADQSPSHNQTHRKQHGGRSKGGGFYLSKRAGSRSPRLDDADDVPSAEVDLNGKYYFPSYGLETDPSDNTDIASEPEPLLLSKIGTGSTYPEAGLARGSVVVPRFSAMPRTESMEVQPSSTNSDEYDERRRVKGHADSDTDTDSDDSLVDSLDGYGSPAPRNHRKKPPPAGQPTDTTTTGGSSTDKSPRHEKGEAFFVPIHAETTNVETLRLHERVIVADTMPLKIKERLNNRRRLMKWKQEQENLKKQRKLMRTIEQRRFYGEPAIQVISTIDKAISRKEIIPPAAKKAVFGASARGTPGGSFTGATPFRAMKPKKRAATGAGSALRSELGMLESYKIDGKGNMQIQTPSTGAASSAAASAGATRKAATKSPWGQTAERRGQGRSKETPGSTSTSMMGGHTTASTTVGSVGKPSTGRTASRGQDVRRKQVLKDVQQMTLYPQADLTPDIEGGPRRMYQKTEIQEGDKHIEILEIVECADSAPRTRGRPARAHSGGRRSRHSGDSHSKHHRSRIPVPIYRFGHYRRSGSSREGSPLSAGGVVNAKVDRMIADLLLEALVNNPDDVGVKFVKTPEGLRDGAKSTKKSTSGGGSSKKGHSAPSANSNSGASNNNNLLTPRRTASGKYTQKFEVIPEERSSVSIESSTEELSTSGRKKPHPSPRRVSFDENHQILNGDELEGAQTPIQLTVPSPAKTPQQQPQPSPKHRPVQAAPVSPRKTATVSPAKSPSRTVAGKKQQGATATVTATTATTTSTTTTTSRGKAAIQSDVIEEKGWIGFSTQHEDMATPVTNGHDDEGITSYIARIAHETGFSNPLSGDGIALESNDHRGHHNHHPDHDNHSDAESFVTDSLNTKPTPPSRHCCRTAGNVADHRLDHLPYQLVTPVTTTVVENRQTVRSCHRSGHSVNELKVPAVGSSGRAGPNLAPGVICIFHKRFPDILHQIREENAWHVFQTADCKVIQSKIEYYETSIHRTPQTNGQNQQQQQNQQHYHGSGTTADLFGPLVEHGRGVEDAFQLCGSTDQPPKTAETTCSSCCFCNPDLHRRTAGRPSDSCFYCHAKALSQSPSKSFPAPPTPPNIQTPSPAPASPQALSENAELTPTPSLTEIKLPERKPVVPKAPAKKEQKVSQTTGTKSKGSEASDTKAKAPEQTTKTGSKQAHEKTPKRTNPSYLPPATGGSTATTHTNATTAPSMASAESAPEPPALAKVASLTPKLSRKKLGEPGGATNGAGVLNRPKHINHLSRASTVVHSVQKEVKNELKTPIRVLPKTAKEVNNRKEKERQISLNLPLGTASVQGTVRKDLLHRQSTSMASLGTIGFERSRGMQSFTVEPDTGHGNDSSSISSSGSVDSTPNSSPFKTVAPNQGKPTAGERQDEVSQPTAATRWKTNSERNLSQLAIQKMVSASKWGSKWRKASTNGEPQTRSNHHTTLEDDLDTGRERHPGGRLLSAGSCSDLSPMKSAHQGGDLLGHGGSVGLGSMADRTASSNIISGITQTSSNQGWTVTVAGNYNPDMAPDVEMRLSFPKGASTGSTGSGGKSQITAGSGSVATSNGNMLQHQQDTNSNYHANGLTHPAGGRHHRQSQQQNYAVLDHLDGSVGYVGGSRNSSRAATLPPPQPPPGGLNPKRNLTRTDGTGAGTTSKDYRLPNVGPTHNILARPTAKKAIKVPERAIAPGPVTVECSVVASATRTIANNYHQLSHQHQLENHGGHHPYPGQPHHSYASRGPTTAGTGSTGTGTTTTTTTKGGQHRSRQSHTTLPGASAQPVLHPALQNGSGGKHNAYYDHRQQQHHPPTRRMSLDGQQQQLQQQPATMMADCLSIMGNAIAPELKPKVPTMSEKDLTRRHHPCYTRTQPYFS
ncbi:hypothetical protein ZHAS_00020264 [Anopheles sinensis]|uniref:Uncharacterized protein n=1 Tax=Anopheles sinensis TaxID=74873 RepID=A0A084WPD3_ANOSI|nr:hypothetical protein ZHAS_00020264 [Anopheles sinensis]